LIIDLIEKILLILAHEIWRGRESRRFFKENFGTEEVEKKSIVASAKF